MPDDREFRIVGVGASPYTRKLRAAARFRRLPFRFVVAGTKEANALPQRSLPLLPYIVAPDADGALTQVQADSTPILDFLEAEYPQRRLRPADGALRFLDLLIEDYGDEWLSKCMFHYRWSQAPDTERASAYLPYTTAIQLAPDLGARAAAAFAARQISRIGVVGSNAMTGPVIEASWRRFLEVFDAHIQNQPFLLGHRPGAGDFACYGQMTMLVITDPTPSAVAFEVSPRAYAWTERCEDLSGLDVSDDDWIDLGDPPETFRAVLAEMGRVYAPFMLANADAVARGAEQVICEIDGQPWRQAPFVYQAKCLRWLREAYSALTPAEQGRVDAVLAGTGCEALLERA